MLGKVIRRRGGRGELGAAMKLNQRGWPLLGLICTGINPGGMVGALKNVHYSIKVDWNGVGPPGQHHHMTIARYKNFPEAKVPLYQGAMTICRSVYEATKGSMRASGHYDANIMPRDQFCQYNGPINEVIGEAREALRRLGGDEFLPYQRISGSQIEVRSQQRGQCPSHWEFDFSHIYSYSSERGETLYSCDKLAGQAEEKHGLGLKAKAKDSSNGKEPPPQVAGPIQNELPRREFAPIWPSFAISAAFWQSNWVPIPGGISLFVVGIGVTLYIINTRKVRLDSATF